ncbi:MAG: glycosyltransferase [Bryobacteraceae bacterium]|nr:glycosyltransferase [Bryobacteraceae bacterium]
MNPHLGLEFPEPFLLSPRLRVHSLADRIAEVHIHVPREPVYHHRLLTADEQNRVWSALRRILDAYGVSKPVIVTSLPTWTDAALKLRSHYGGSLIYDCHDLIEGFDNMSADIVQVEEKLFEASSLVLFSSEWLAEHKALRHPQLTGKSVLIRNGVEFERFESVETRRHGGVGFTVIYAGSLNFWFDVQTVLRAAEARPDWQFALIGRIESPRIGLLRQPKNVRLVGEVPYSELPDWFSRADAAIIPFLDLPLTRATDPIKLYEYLASGLPVVSSPLPELRRFSHLVSTYTTVQEFVSALENARNEDPERRRLRKDAARAESWASRCSAFESMFPALLAANGTAIPRQTQ